MISRGLLAEHLQALSLVGLFVGRSSIVQDRAKTEGLNRITQLGGSSTFVQ